MRLLTVCPLVVSLACVITLSFRRAASAFAFARSFHRDWSSQALGFVGKMLGWTSFLQNQVRSLSSLIRRLTVEFTMCPHECVWKKSAKPQKPPPLLLRHLNATPASTGSCQGRRTAEAFHREAPRIPPVNYERKKKERLQKSKAVSGPWNESPGDKKGTTRNRTWVKRTQSADLTTGPSSRTYTFRVLYRTITILGNRARATLPLMWTMMIILLGSVERTEVVEVDVSHETSKRPKRGLRGLLGRQHWQSSRFIRLQCHCILVHPFMSRRTETPYGGQHELQMT